MSVTIWLGGIGPDGRRVGDRRAGWKSRQRVRVDRFTTRRPGDDDHQLPQHIAASWNDGCWTAENELGAARFQGRHVAEITARLEGGAGERGPAPKEMQNPTETPGGTGP